MKNPIGIYYAYWERDWQTGLLSYPKRAAHLGFDLLEVKLSVVEGMSERERQRLRSEAEEAGIELTFCDALTASRDISSPDPEIRKRGIEFLKRGLEVVHKMGGNLLGGILYGAWNPPASAGQHKQDRLYRSVESMREVVRVAEDLGVDCAVEAVNRFEHFLINTSREAVAYIRMVESPNLKVMLDTFHMNIEEDDIYDAIVFAGKDLGHMHIGEPNRRLPGQGRFPWAELARALASIGYCGRLVMEPFVQPGGEIGHDIRVWRDLTEGENLDHAVRKSLEFIRALFFLRRHFPRAT